MCTCARIAAWQVDDTEHRYGEQCNVLSYVLDRLSEGVDVVMYNNYPTVDDKRDRKYGIKTCLCPQPHMPPHLNGTACSTQQEALTHPCLSLT